jgi:phosphoribosylformylglycinamidine (FGAM) synthase-like enzyme
MTIDDFEWVEKGFDNHVFVHKTREMAVAVVHHFNGWYVKVLKTHGGVVIPAEQVDNLEAAKVIAMIHVNQNMEGYPNANNYSKRAIPAGPQKIPRRVFKVD